MGLVRQTNIQKIYLQYRITKTVKKSMVTGIAQKSCTALFPLRSLRKNDISKMKKKYKEETLKALKGILILNREKNKKYTYLDYALTALSVFFLFVSINIRFSFT